MIANPNYSAEIKISQTDRSDTVLQAFNKEKNAILPSAVMPLADQVFDELSPHFCYCRESLGDVLSRPSFHIDKISRDIIAGHELVRIDHNYIYYWDPPSYKVRRQKHLKGSIYLDPSHCWCIKRIKNSEKVFKDGVEDNASEWDIQFETLDHPSGFPILKSRTCNEEGYSERAKRKIIYRYKYDYQLEVKHNLPDTDFSLSAIGLPEPIGLPVKKPIPAYVWVLAASGLCAFLALGFRYLARRIRPTTPT